MQFRSPPQLTLVQSLDDKELQRVRHTYGIEADYILVSWFYSASQKSGAAGQSLRVIAKKLVSR